MTDFLIGIKKKQMKLGQRCGIQQGAYVASSIPYPVKKLRDPHAAAAREKEEQAQKELEQYQKARDQAKQAKRKCVLL